MSKHSECRSGVASGETVEARGLARAILCGCLATVAACAHRPVVSQSRLAGTGIEPLDGVVILVTTYVGPRAVDVEGVPPPIATKGERTALERCLTNAMHKRARDLRIVPSEDFREEIAPDTSFPVTPRGADEVLASLADEAFASRARAFKLRYIILLSGFARNGQGRTTFEADNGIWGIGREWDRTTTLDAEVVDVSRGRRAGSVRSSDVGVRGFMVPVFVIIPLPPVGYGSRSRGPACVALGLALETFLAEEGSVEEVSPEDPEAPVGPSSRSGPIDPSVGLDPHGWSGTGLEE